MADGVMFGSYIGGLKAYYGERVAFLAKDYYDANQENVFCLFTSTGKYDNIPRSEIRVHEISKITNFNRKKGAFYDNRTSKPSHRLP